MTPTSMDHQKHLSFNLVKPENGNYHYFDTDKKHIKLHKLD